MKNLNQWIEVEDDVWMNPVKDITIELYSEFDSHKLIFTAGEVAKTKLFPSRKIALDCVHDIIKNRNPTLTEIF